MHIQSMAQLSISSVQRARSGRAPARLAVGTIALLSFAVARAQLPVQQLTVAFTNAFPNGSVDTLTMPGNSAAIAATNPLFTGGTLKDVYTALAWVTNPATSTLDLIYADAEQHKIWRLPGPGYQNPTLIFSWTSKGSGPPYPMGLAADPAGNVYVISPGSIWDGPGVWVLPINAAGGYGPPLLIDHTFTDPATGKPVTTLALAEVLVAGGAATPVSAAAPVWNALDLLVLVGDTFNSRVIRYSQDQIQSVLTSQGPLHGPASTVVTQAQFSTQALTVDKIKIPPVPVGMDIGQDPNTQDMTLLFSTAFGSILDFDSYKNAFITPYAINLGFGLTRLKVGTFQGAPYVFVGQLPGRILEFAAPRPGGSDTTPFASVSKGVTNPSDLAVTTSGSTVAGACVNTPCSILPQLSLEITGSGTANIPPNAAIVADSCTLIDPRVTTTDGVRSYEFEPLDLGNYCPNLPQVFLSSNMFGDAGPTGAGIYAAKITASALNQYGNMATPINNTLTSFIVNPSLALGINQEYVCGTPNGPIVAWGPLPGVESMIPEGSTLIDITVACMSDPPPAGKGNHPSILIEGISLVGLNATYIDGEFGNLQLAFNHILTPAVEPPATQIVDPTGLGIVTAIQGYITNGLSYFNQQNYNCALNTLAMAARYVNSMDMTSPGDFLAGPPPNDDENAAGTLIARFDHLYYDVNIFARNPPITTDVLNPATIVPTCTSLWTQQSPATSPPARIQATMATATHGNVVLFSGVSAGVPSPSALLNDTWIWNGTNWTQQSPATSPPARYSAMMATDAASGGVVLFGGYGSVGAAGQAGYLNDTWIWNGTNWTQQSPATSPPARYVAMMATDTHGNVVLFGGQDVPQIGAALSDTWIWNGTNWTQQSPANSPPARYGATMATDASSGGVVLFGGYGPGGYLNDTWIWNGTNWTQQSPATSPPARYVATMATDTHANVVLFGGVSPTGGYLNDTWIWNGTNWTQQSPAISPPARDYATTATDASSGGVVLFGGYGASGYLNDTWTFVAPALPASAWVGTWDGQITSTCGYISGPFDVVITSAGGSQLSLTDNYGDAYALTISGSNPDLATSVSPSGITYTISGSAMTVSYPAACQTGSLARQ